VAARRITIFDTTLRDGEQSPGIALQPHEKAEIATQLDRLGVDVVEAGFSVSSPGDFEGVRAVAAAVERPAVASLARTRKEDIDAAAESLADARRSRIHVLRHGLRGRGSWSATSISGLRPRNGQPRSRRG